MAKQPPRIPYVEVTSAEIEVDLAFDDFVCGVKIKGVAALPAHKGDGVGTWQVRLKITPALNEIHGTSTPLIQYVFQNGVAWEAWCYYFIQNDGPYDWPEGNYAVVAELWLNGMLADTSSTYYFGIWYD